MSQFALLLASLLLVPSPGPSVDVVSYQQTGPRMAVARVKNWTSGYQVPGPTVSGTGTLTAVHGSQGLVLTAAHLFEGTVGPVTVEFKDGQNSGARILAIDRKLDVAALWIYAPAESDPCRLLIKSPDVGADVEIWGYGPKRFRSFAARVARPIPMAGDVPAALFAAQGVQDKQVTIPGDSGGPMIAQGRLVAVHWGYRGGEDDPRRCVHALGCAMLRQWLREHVAASVWQQSVSLAR